MSAATPSPKPFRSSRARGGLWMMLSFIVALPAGAAVELAPGIWVDDDAQRVFLSNPAGLPEAREFSDGRLLWTGEEQAHLLIPVDTQWLALGQAGRHGWGMLLVIDGASGKVQDRIAFDLPEGVSAAVTAEPMRSFDVRAENLGGSVRLHWSYQARPLRGALLVEDNAAVASEGVELQGVVDVQLGGARMVALPRLDVEPQPLGRSPDLPTEQRIAGLGERQFRSSDDAHVLAPHAREDDTFGTVWQWRFASRSEGAIESSIEQPFALAPFLMREGRLLYQAPPMGYAKSTGEWQEHGQRLVMFDLADGRELWSAELLDRVFRGALPP